ncbi:hypothetical protein LR48_Vigan02g074800 [Vigna angularis]|uniref:Uncharacterized protein n=1 Tax=Phaseolus angularis TaxID=3914 RepID=A0A0L9TVH7_PHAAN|nr:hypothetical protein LR48_Vigan02g074800 [Vigna angularis]
MVEAALGENTPVVPARNKATQLGQRFARDNGGEGGGQTVAAWRWMHGEENNGQPTREIEIETTLRDKNGERLRSTSRLVVEVHPVAAIRVWWSLWSKRKKGEVAPVEEELLGELMDIVVELFEEVGEIYGCVIELCYVVQSCVLVVVEYGLRAKLFVLDVRYTNVFTPKSLRRREIGPLVTRSGRLEAPYLEKQVCEVRYRG